MGAPKAVAMPTAAPAVTKSRLSFGLRKRVNSPVDAGVVRGVGVVRGAATQDNHAADGAHCPAAPHLWSTAWMWIAPD